MSRVQHAATCLLGTTQSCLATNGRELASSVLVIARGWRCPARLQTQARERDPERRSACPRLFLPCEELFWRSPCFSRRWSRPSRDPPKVHPSPSKSAETESSHASPAELPTCSPKMIGGRHLRMSSNHAGQRCRGSLKPLPRPAALKGWQGQDPVQ